ncbi:MAG: MBL fold metallo-hydrolase [Gemmatimonadales bacterium]|nr:MBL fold metallo-hydrolase [Gemmatimonadales bacterium]
MRVFSTGRVRQKRGRRGIRRYLLDEWSETTLPVNVFLIEHPDGLCLVDAGQTAAAAHPGYFPAWYPFFRLARFELNAGEEASAQLSLAGYDPKRLRWLVMTHMHTDHAGGVVGFPDTEVIVARVEWEAAQGLGGRLRGYLPQHWPVQIRPRVIDFSGPPIGPFPASYDIASDGRLLMVPFPGHTRGHSALLVRIDPAQAYLCAGDAAPTASALASVAPEIAAWCQRNNVVVLTTHDDTAIHLLRGTVPFGK